MEDHKVDIASRVARRRSFDLSLIALASAAFVFGASPSRWRELISDLLSLSSL